MMFQETYHRMNSRVAPTPALVDATLQKAGRPRRRSAAPLRRAVAVAAVIALCLSTTALAARTELGYDLLCAVAPGLAQSFQPVALVCTDNGVTMEVVSVRVEGDTAQAYIALTGETVDETTDLFDSYSLQIPFDQASRCELAGYDAQTHTALFLVTVQTADGQPIPGGKMTVSLRRFLTGKQTTEGAAVALDLSACAAEAETAAGHTPFGGGGTDYETYAGAPMLQPREDALAEPSEHIAVTAAGYAEGLFHVQVSLAEQMTLDTHCWLWLEDAAGDRLEALAGLYFDGGEQTDADYVEFLFRISPDELANHTLHGDFYTASTLTEGNWRVTFPLTDTVA